MTDKRSDDKRATLAGPSASGHSCQVRQHNVQCPATPEVEIAMVIDGGLGGKPVRRSVRACLEHAALLKRKYDGQIADARPWPRPTP